MAEHSIPHKIGNGSIVLLVGGAILCDLIGLIPFVKDFLDPLFWIAASLYFWHLGMGLFSGRKLAITAVSFVAGMIPVIQEFPELTMGIIAIIFVTRLEEKTGLSLIKPLAKGDLEGAKRAFAGRTPPMMLNQDGRREPTNQRMPANQAGTRPPVIETAQTENDEEEAVDNRPDNIISLFPDGAKKKQEDEEPEQGMPLAA